MDSKEISNENKQPDNKKTESTNVKSKNVNGYQSRTPPAHKQKKKMTLKSWEVSENTNENTMATTLKSPSLKSFNKNNETPVDFSKDVDGDAITSIEIFKDDSADTVLLLESSDDDEVVEIALPPKPTIYIESSDEEEPSTSKEDTLPDVSLQNEDLKVAPEKNLGKNITQKSNERNPTCSSPVPSVVSSVSDDFIRGDCVALNISNKQQEKTFDFDFNQHGTDLMDENRNNSLVGSNKKKKQKQKTNKNVAEGNFAKPKNKSKTKKQTKYVDRDMPKPDIKESDCSNQSLENISDVLLSVEEKDKSETTASQSIDVETTVTSVEDNSMLDISDAANNSWMTVDTTGEIVGPTTDEPIVENIMIANVSGISSIDSRSTTILLDEVLEIKDSIYQPELLAPGYEFSNPQVMEKHILEMRKFYDQSWGGERFDHQRIMQKMPRDKSLWRIMPADRAPKRYFHGPTCNFCNQSGHRDDRCFLKVKKCYMCGREGHTEPRCPNKICLNCGSPNYLYSGGCNRCASWARMTCNICHVRGHPATACPDTWRRYHRTLKHDGALVQFRRTKKSGELSCSGCTRQGHLVHTCSQFIKFSRLPVANAYIQQYVPLYEPPAEKPINRRDFINSSTSRAGKTSKKSTLIAPDALLDTQKNDSNVMQITIKNNSVSTKTTQQTSSIPKRQVTILAETPTAKKRCLSDNAVINTSTPHASRAPNFSPEVCLSGTPKSKLNQTPKSNSFSETGTIIANASVTSVETPPFKVLGKRKLELVEIENNKSVSEGNRISLLSSTEDAQLNKFDDVQKKLNTTALAGSGLPLVQDNRVSNSEDVIKSYYINISQDEYNTFNSIEGSEYINVIKLRYKLKTINLNRPNSEIPLYVITFEGNHHPTLKQRISEDLLSWLLNKRKQISKKSNPEDDIGQPPSATVGSNVYLDCNLPKKRKLLLALLLKEMSGLQNDLGDPKAIHKELLYLEKHHATLLKEKSISHQKMSNSRQKINKHLKALNMILLGQAGLADGAKCLNALYSITDQLQAGSYEVVADNLRRKAAQNYNVLFSSASRTDYPQLMNKYYLYRNDKSFQKVGQKMAAKNAPKQKNKKKKLLYRAMNQTQPQPLLQKDKGSDNREILKKVGFCTSRLRTMLVTSAPQQVCVRNYLGQLHFIWQHLRNRASSNHQEVHKHADHLTSEVLAFLNGVPTF